MVAQQEVSVQTLAHHSGIWSLRLLNSITRAKAEETYLAHQFVYAKATDAVKARLKQKNEEQAHAIHR